MIRWSDFSRRYPYLSATLKTLRDLTTLSVTWALLNHLSETNASLFDMVVFYIAYQITHRGYLSDNKQ